MTLARSGLVIPLDQWSRWLTIRHAHITFSVDLGYKYSRFILGGTFILLSFENLFLSGLQGTGVICAEKSVLKFTSCTGSLQDLERVNSVSRLCLPQHLDHRSLVLALSWLGALMKCIEKLGINSGETCSFLHTGHCLDGLASS